LRSIYTRCSIVLFLCIGSEVIGADTKAQHPSGPVTQQVPSDADVYIVPKNQREIFCKSQEEKHPGKTEFNAQWPRDSRVVLGAMGSGKIVKGFSSESADSIWLIDCYRCGLGQTNSYISPEFCKQYYPEIGWDKGKEEIKKICHN